VLGVRRGIIVRERKREKRSKGYREGYIMLSLQKVE
jgi:hypothetical protein